VRSKKVTVVRIDTTVNWKTLRAKGGNWVAVCDPLGLTIQAETYVNLMEDIGFTLDAVLNDLLNSNELDTFLRDHGWELIGTIPARKTGIRFDVPFVPEIVPTMPGAYGSKKCVR